MRILILSLVITMAASAALAKSKEAMKIDLPEMTPVYSAKKLIYRYACLNEMTDFLAETHKIILAPAFSSMVNGDIQYACRKVVVDIVSGGGETGSMYAERNMWALLTVKCEQRTTSEKQLFSLVHRCEENPVPECFSTERKQEMDLLKPTSFVIEQVEEICSKSFY